MTFDILIAGGDVIDGSGAERKQRDIGIRGDRIVAIGSLDGAEAAKVVDARGKVVTPGFIDPHSHSDWTLNVNRDAQSTIRQGVTTEVVGNCGITNAPVSDASLASVSSRLATHGYAEPPSWRSFNEYLSDVASGGTSQNLAFFVGHSTIRAAAGVGPRPATDDEIAAMGEYVSEAMDAGVLGMSTGLEYDHGRCADTREITELAKIVGRRGGYYASHIRNRDSRLLESVGEFLDIIRAGDMPGEISHLNVRENTGAPPRGWERAVEMMADARASGIDVLADTTPFRQGGGLMIGLLPDWLLDGGYEEAARKLADSDVRRKLRGDCDRYWRFVHKGEWHRVRLGPNNLYPEWTGLRFDEIADLAHKDEWDCFFDVLMAAGKDMASCHMVGDLFTEEHLAQMISHPLLSLGVDAATAAEGDAAAGFSGSPLPFRGHVEYLVHHVREKHTLTLEEAVRKMSGMPAERFKIAQRGLLREGYFADVAVIDFPALRSDSTFDHPAVYPEGVEAVLVNGEIVVEHNVHTGARSGRILSRA